MKTDSEYVDDFYELAGVDLTQPGDEWLDFETAVSLLFDKKLSIPREIRDAVVRWYGEQVEYMFSEKRIHLTTYFPKSWHWFTSEKAIKN